MQGEKHDLMVKCKSIELWESFLEEWGNSLNKNRDLNGGCGNHPIDAQSEHCQVVGREFLRTNYSACRNAFGGAPDFAVCPTACGCPTLRAADSGSESGWCRFAHIAAGPVCDDIRAMCGWAVGRAQEALFTKHISVFHAYGGVQVWAITLDRDAWTRVIRDGLASGSIALP